MRFISTILLIFAMSLTVTVGHAKQEVGADQFIGELASVMDAQRISWVLKNYPPQETLIVYQGELNAVKRDGNDYIVFIVTPDSNRVRASFNVNPPNTEFVQGLKRGQALSGRAYLVDYRVMFNRGILQLDHNSPYENTDD